MSGDELFARFQALWREVLDCGDEALRARIRAEIDGHPAQTAPDAPAAGWHGMLGECAAMRALRPKLEKLAQVDAPVLITGESGTGKEVVARLLHDLGPRAARAFVSENCAAIPATLIESVLFGHVRGAFTGAVRDHPGHFVQADKGTLFLDEIGDMPLALQVKLLRALQEREIRPVGGSRSRKVDVRVVAATNQDLARRVAEGKFREDLYYRLNVLQVHLPPLRERGEDVLLLADAFLARAAPGRQLAISAPARAALVRAAWPGNIRQLQNEMQRLAALVDGTEVRLEDLSPELRA